MLVLAPSTVFPLMDHDVVRPLSLRPSFRVIDTIHGVSVAFSWPVTFNENSGAGRFLMVKLSMFSAV